jgi:guanine deaminase
LDYSPKCGSHCATEFDSFKGWHSFRSDFTGRAGTIAATMTDQDWMRLSIDTARLGIEAGQTPFGAVIVGKDGQLVVAAHNEVWRTTDITAHAEVTAIRRACRSLTTIDLTGCTIYSTTEPCPMCFAACHWAKLARIVFGSTIADARAAGFSELTVSNADMKRLGGSPVEVMGGVLAVECRELFAEWVSVEGKRVY